MSEGEISGSWYAARWHLDRLIAATPGDGSLYARRGFALDQLGLLPEADKDYGEAIERGADGDGPLLSTRRGVVRARLGRWAKADEDFAEATERGSDVVSWYVHALLRLRLGDVDGYRLTSVRGVVRSVRSATRHRQPA